MVRKKCLQCGEPIKGRIDKLYCSAYCKSAFHYQKNKDKGDTLFKKIDVQLKRNRRLLKHFNHAGKSTVRASKLTEAGFDPKYFTHYWKNSRGQVYLFCYDVGFLKIKENGHQKFVLVEWQEYMN